MVKPETRHSRVIAIVRAPNEHGVGIFRIDMAGQATFYTFREIPCEIGGQGFALHRSGLGTLYHTRVGEPQDCSCECLGFLRWGHCKHIEGLLALIRKKMI